MILEMITLVPKRLGEITIPVMFEEAHQDELQITEHPVEKGAEINDHAFKRQPEVVIKCGWSNSDLKALAGTVQAVFLGGSLPSADYISTVYSQLLELQERREPFDVVTSLRMYESMLFKSLAVLKDQKTGAALSVTATLKQLRIVETQATTLPPRENQADPSATAETQNTGVKAATPATPAPGGSVPPTSM
ncbi:MAG: phage baseplate protein [Solimonas sp.]